MPNVFKDFILPKRDTVLQSRWYSPFWWNISSTSSVSSRIQDSCRKPRRVQQKSTRTLELCRWRQHGRTKFSSNAASHPRWDEWNSRIHSRENLKTLKCYGVQQELEYQWDMQNDKWALYGSSIMWEKLHSLCFISHFISCLFTRHLVMLSVLYLYSISGKLINARINVRHWWSPLSLIILQRWTFKQCHTIKELL